jgi:DNA replication ATP-dependent helicase Dna2
MGLPLEERLLGFLEREEDGERRALRDLRALAVEERVVEGECIEGVRLRRSGQGTFEFDVEENLSKFRAGDALVVGDGLDFDGALPLVYGSYDADTRVLRLERDPFLKSSPVRLEEGRAYCVDKRPLGLRDRLRNVVRAAYADELIAAVLEGGHDPGRDASREQRALEHLSPLGLNPAQLRAGAAAIAAESLTLIQGPPGTGKTRLLAEVVRGLCAAGCRIALTAFTHRAVDHALLTLRRLDPDISLVKLGSPGRDRESLARANIRFAHPRRGRLPSIGVVAGTCFALTRLPEAERFHFTVCDEAGQMPIPHALAGMLRSRRWLFFGDHQQLPPVNNVEHGDQQAAASVFEHLHGLYGSYLLDTTYRMNDQICRVVSDAFYDGGLHPAPEVASRRMPFRPGGHFDEILDPERSIVLARVDHLQPGLRSVEEANLAADLVDEIVRRHGVPPADVAVIAPFRAQVRMLRSALQKKGLPAGDPLVVDTVERMQGQEREVILVSLAVGDPDCLQRRSSFFFSTNRLNVSLSRARTKAILVASAGAFRALPLEVESLRAASAFKSLRQRLPQVDLTKVYSG